MFDFLKKRKKKQEEESKQARSEQRTQAAPPVQPPKQAPQQTHPTQEAPKKSAAAENPGDEPMLDDISYIKEMKHIASGAWHQYDVLLAARGYGWETMVDWAAYLESADIRHIDQLTVAQTGTAATDLSAAYKSAGTTLKTFEPLSVERGMLSIAGFSKAAGGPIKFVWFNQTRLLRVFSMSADEILMKKYIETAIRRSFGTKDAMKLAKPVPEEE